MNKMIDFACKKFDLEDVIRCSFALTKADYEILKFLMKNDKEFSTQEISVKLNLDKSTIQRGVKKLHEKQLVFRGQINKSVGGYLFTYKVKEKDKIRKIILDIIEGWVETFRREIRKW